MFSSNEEHPPGTRIYGTGLSCMAAVEAGADPEAPGAEGQGESVLLPYGLVRPLSEGYA